MKTFNDTKSGPVIPYVMNKPCDRHGAESGEPCWVVNGKNGVCNSRVQKTGFNGKISTSSISLSRGAKK